MKWFDKLNQEQIDHLQSILTQAKINAGALARHKSAHPGQPNEPCRICRGINEALGLPVSGVRTEEAPDYHPITKASDLPDIENELYGLLNDRDENKVISRAIEILESRIKRDKYSVSSPDHVKDFVKLKIQRKEHEVFCVLFLDNKHCVICWEEMFRGSVSTASVYPREVVKEALKANAAAVILVHNHPSGSAEPSQADIHITKRLQSALETVDIRVLDHLIVGDDVMAFSERGLL